jgi:hypothetical protein
VLRRAWSGPGLRRAVAALALVVIPFAGRLPAHATPPGVHGKIAFASTRDGNLEIF